MSAEEYMSDHPSTDGRCSAGHAPDLFRMPEAPSRPRRVARYADPVSLDAIAGRYEADGFCFPIRAVSESEAAASLARAVAIATEPGDGKRFLRTKSHLACRFVDELARTPAILDCVERILGPDILLWGSTCFAKAPRSPSYVSWHQDLNYWGLDTTEEVTAWLALSPSNETNGCMCFVPGSHRRGRITHHDSFRPDNMLSRGQELEVEVAEGEAVPVCLAPGEISLHHGRMFHASGPNRSDGWRVGLAFRYITPSTRQVVGVRDFAQLVRGEDRFGHFEELPRPLDDEDLAAMRRFDFVEGVTGSIFYAAADRYSGPSGESTKGAGSDGTAAPVEEG